MYGLSETVINRLLNPITQLLPDPLYHLTAGGAAWKADLKVPP